MSLNQAVITQVLHDLKNGRLRRCLDMGFTNDDLLALKKPEILTLLINTSVPWCDITVNTTVLQALLNASEEPPQEAMPINRAVITQVLYDLKNGRLRRCLDMGFTNENLVALKKPEILTLLVNTSVPWCRVIVNATVLKALLNTSEESLQEVLLIDRMLNLSASSKMICEVFALTQREVAFRRSLLGMEKRQGRWTELTDEQENELWRYWLTLIDKYGFDVHNERDLAKSCMWLADEKDLTMAQLWMAIQKWVADGLHS